MADKPQPPSALDTTPKARRPSQDRIDAAERDIPRILEDTHPQFDGRTVLRAGSLVEKLRGFGHSLAAAQWAIHQSIESDRLKAELIQWGGVINKSNVSSKLVALAKLADVMQAAVLESGKQRREFEKRKQIHFENFCVVATESLWEWHNSKTCLSCGSVLKGKDKDRQECFDCRSERGKVIELWVELNMVNDSGNPNRIKQWQFIKSWLNECENFEQKFSLRERFELACSRITNRLGYDRETVLRMNLDDVLALMKSGVLAKEIESPKILDGKISEQEISTDEGAESQSAKPATFDKAHGDKPRLVAFESRTLGGNRNQAQEPPPRKTVDQWRELPPGHEYTTDKNGFVTSIQATAAERERLNAESLRRSEELTAQKARELPVYPFRDGYKGEAPPEVVAVVRKVLTDWDGANWVAVRHCIELTRRESESKDLDDWTLDDVRQRFAIGQKVITKTLGGTLQTTEGTVTPLEVGTFAVEQNEPESKDHRTMLVSLPRSHRNAHRAFEYAQEQRECELTYGDAWEYLNEYGFEDCEDLRGYKLPLQTTFETYVAKALNALGTPRNTPRGGRKTRSTVRADEI